MENNTVSQFGSLESPRPGKSSTQENSGSEAAGTENSTSALESTVPTQENSAVENPTPAPEENENDIELRRLQNELARQKIATDKAAREAAEYKRQLRASKTAEEQRAEDEREEREAMKRELEELRKRNAVAELSKSAFTLSQDEASAKSIAEMMYGAEDAEGAIDAIKRIVVAREKRLRAEYGKTPTPGSGSEEVPIIPKAKLISLPYKEILNYAQKYPDAYKRIMNSED